MKPYIYLLICAKKKKCKKDKLETKETSYIQGVGKGGAGERNKVARMRREWYFFKCTFYVALTHMAMFNILEK